ncbi:MAG: TonB-dependent receptor [Parvularculaceae bacterium]
MQAAEVVDTLVVTTQRRAVPLQSTAGNIAVIDGAELIAISADHIAEAINRAPGVGLQRGSGAEQLTAIRSPVLTAGAGAGSFLYLENGVALRSAGFANINGLFDSHYEIANAIEIVRGPSGAVYGANAIHGVINVLTPKPSEDPSRLFEMSGDTQDRYKWKGTASGVRDGQGFFVGASAVSEAGYRRDAGLDQQKLTLRHVVDGDGVALDTIFSFDNLEQETAGFIFGADVLHDRERRKDNAYPMAYRDGKSARLQSTLTLDLANGTEVKVTPYARWNRLEFPQHFLPSNALEENGHWSVGVQSLAYRELAGVSVYGGVDAEYTSGWLREFQSQPTIFSYTQGLHYDYEVDAINASGFVGADIKAGDGITLSGAVRVDGAIYDYHNRTDSGVVGRFLRPDDQTDSFVTASPKFSVRYEPRENVTLHASYARGARPPQTTDLYRLQINQTGARARPETIDAFEISTRVRAGDRLSMSLAGFYMNKNNFFFRDSDGFNVSDGKTRHVGVEADIRIALHDTLTLSSALTYAVHSYRFGRITGSASETITSGDDVDTAPRVLANTRLAWRPVDALTAEAEWVSVGRYYTDAANAHEYGGHNLLNLRAQAALTSSFATFISVRNVTNALYAERADFAFGEDRYFPGETRTFAFGIRYAH